MTTFKIYITQSAIVTVEASTLDEAEQIALEFYNSNPDLVERFKPEVENYDILPPEAA